MKKTLTQKLVLILLCSTFTSYVTHAQDWSLNGNTGTTPLTNFLGTTDTARLILRTNNLARETILSNGNVGIGTFRPARLLQVHNSGSADNNIMVTGSAPSVYFFQNEVPISGDFTIPYSRIGLATSNGSFIATAQPGDFVLHAVTDNASLIFGVGVNTAGNGVERARISSSGLFGINTTTPTAQLHVNGTLRFQGLSTGTGKTLVVDTDGNVFVSTTTNARVAADSNDDVTALKQEVSDLKQALAEVQATLATIQSSSLQVTNSSQESFVLANTPNPFSGSTTIRYTYPRSASQAYLTVTDLNGNPVRRFDLKGNNSSSINLTLDGAAGTYIYSLEVDGKITSSKKMVFTK